GQSSVAERNARARGGRLSEPEIYENAHAERINGTIKNGYLAGYAPQDFNELKNMLKKAVEMYNTQRPHQSLGGLTPWQFEHEGKAYPPKQGLLTKEKRTKKEKINNSNNFVKHIPKKVNLI
ncbi:MAG: integrase core domain-containing protein, partial [Bacteroidia bacterium]